LQKKVDDPNKCEDEERKKNCIANGGRILYRGDIRSPSPTNPVVGRDGIFIRGFSSRDRKFDNLFRYAEHNDASIYIGTSPKYSVAKNFAVQYLKKNTDKGYVYAICDPDPSRGIDVNSKLAEEGLKTRFSNQNEVVFTHSISNRAIISATQYNKAGIEGGISTNPNYIPNASP
jgi:hypothetical protein